MRIKLSIEGRPEKESFTYIYQDSLKEISEGIAKLWHVKPWDIEVDDREYKVNGGIRYGYSLSEEKG